MDIRLKRAYDAPTRTDGTRVLIDRIWPRGIKKTDAKIDLWLRDIAPSTELRKWFVHDPEKWDEFQRRYAEELQNAGEALETLQNHCANGRITLVYAAKDTAHNNAVVLEHILQQREKRD
jgi:uncharacterized protein YeaO (DUF488 family)